VGLDADLVLVDPDAEHEIRNDDMYSPNRLTPFDGVLARGKPILTLLRGQLIAEDGRAIGQPSGRQVRPG
jgi:dihydroorotase-like cyclic amidohydrolase